VKLGEVCELKYGKGLPQRKRIGGEFPVYGSGGVVDYHKEFYVEGPGIIVGRYLGRDILFRHFLYRQLQQSDQNPLFPHKCSSGLLKRLLAFPLLSSFSNRHHFRF